MKTTALVLTLILTLVSAAVRAASYYVAPSGNDTNPGTLSQPWATIVHAASAASGVGPGDTVYIRAGTYNGTIAQGVSGTSGAPITYIAYSGEAPVVTGTSGKFRWRIDNHSHLRIEGLTFKDYHRGGIRVRAVNQDQKGIHIINNRFVNQSVDVSWDGNGYDCIAVVAYYPPYIIEDIVIKDNYFENIETGDIRDMRVISIEYRVLSLLIEGNEINGCSSLGITTTTATGFGGGPEKVIIKNNVIHGHGWKGGASAGIYLDAPGIKNLIEGNRVYGGNAGIKAATEWGSRDLETVLAIVRRNIIYDNGTWNLKMGSGNFSETCAVSGQARDCVAVHNTVASTVADKELVNNRFGCGQGLRFKNNIYYHVDLKRQYDMPPSDIDFSTWEVDYNLFYDGNPSVWYQWDGATYNGFSAFNAAVNGYDDNSFEADPLFVDVAQKDFALQTGSPAIDAGGPLTAASSGKSNSTALDVVDSRYFSDGFGLQPGDVIRIGCGGSAVIRTVVAVNYDTHRLTLNSAASWSNGAAVNYDYSGSGPDIGALESGSTGSAPAAPSNLTATAVSSSQIDLSWSDNSNNETGFKIERKTGAGGTYSQINTTGANATSYNDTGLSASTTYYYRVRATNGNGDSGYSNEANATTQSEGGGGGAFQQDSGSQGIVSMEAENAHDNVSLGGHSWSTVISPTGYSGAEALQATPDNGTYRFNNYADGPRLEFQVNFVKTGTHYIWVRGHAISQGNWVHGGLDGTASATTKNIQVSITSGWEWSSTRDNGNRAKFEVASTGTHVVGLWMSKDGFTVDKIVLTTDANYTPTGAGPAESPRDGGGAPPDAPTNLSATTVSSSQIDLSWTASTGADSYKVKRSTTSGGPYTTITNVTSTSFSNTGLSSGTTYYYVVSALNAAGESANSSQAGATTAPAAPTGLSATAVSSSQIDLSWTGSTGTTSYNVKRSTTSGGPYTTITNVTATSFSNTDLSSGTTYYYVVSALNSGGESANSSQASATTESGGAFQQDSGSQGIVSMEAENAHDNVSLGGHSWSTVTSPSGYSGTEALQATPDNGTYRFGNYADGPRLEFQVNFVKTGTHYIWVRGHAISQGNWVHGGLDGTAPATGKNIQVSITSGWEWSSTRDNGNRAKFEVASTGTHVVGLWMSKDGFTVDKIVLTTSSSYTPTGTGPAESPQQ